MFLYCIEPGLCDMRVICSKFSLKIPLSLYTVCAYN
jgi:hypothetical protein